MAFLTELFSRPRPSATIRMPLPATEQVGLADTSFSTLAVRPADFPRPPRQGRPVQL